MRIVIAIIVVTTVCISSIRGQSAPTPPATGPLQYAAPNMNGRGSGQWPLNYFYSGNFFSALGVTVANATMMRTNVGCSSSGCGNIPNQIFTSADLRQQAAAACDGLGAMSLYVLAQTTSGQNVREDLLVADVCDNPTGSTSSLQRALLNWTGTAYQTESSTVDIYYVPPLTPYLNVTHATIYASLVANSGQGAYQVKIPNGVSILGAGTISASNGQLRYVTNCSGHFMPSAAYLVYTAQFIQSLSTSNWNNYQYPVTAASAPNCQQIDFPLTPTPVNDDL